MKLSISNIAWNKTEENSVLNYIKDKGFNAIEIAPSKCFGNKPYENLNKVKEWYKDFYNNWGINISSMQSIWFGINQNMFNSKEDFEYLINYTKKAILFAEAINCKNLVFGCPKNRNIESGKSKDAAYNFFQELGDYAFEHNTVIGMEANPKIYNTNFINETQSAIELIKKVNSKGFKLNLDIGTMVQNNENISLLNGYEELVNHIHISEPFLKPIEHRNLHYDLADFLKTNKYQGYVSIEMGTVDCIEIIYNAIDYATEVFK